MKKVGPVSHRVKITESCQRYRVNCLKNEKVLILYLELDTTMDKGAIPLNPACRWRAKGRANKRMMEGRI